MKLYLFDAKSLLDSESGVACRLSWVIRLARDRRNAEFAITIINTRAEENRIHPRGALRTNKLAQCPYTNARHTATVPDITAAKRIRTRLEVIVKNGSLESEG